MTSKEIWDIIMEIYQSNNPKNTVLVVSSIDDHFNCYFEQGNDQIHFRITINNNFFGDPSYTINNIYRFKENGSIDMVSEAKLKKYLVPIIREAKLNLIGI